MAAWIFSHTTLYKKNLSWIVTVILALYQVHPVAGAKKKKEEQIDVCSGRVRESTKTCSRTSLLNRCECSLRLRSLWKAQQQIKGSEDTCTLHQVVGLSLLAACFCPVTQNLRENNLSKQSAGSPYCSFKLLTEHLWEKLKLCYNVPATSCHPGHIKN